MRTTYAHTSPASSIEGAPIGFEKCTRNKRKFRAEARPPLAELEEDKKSMQNTDDLGLVNSGPAVSREEIANAISKCTEHYGASTDWLHASRNPSSKEQESHAAAWGDYTERELEELLMKNIEATFKDALDRVVSMGYSSQEALDAILKNGHRCGLDGNALSNIVDNAVACLKSGKQDQDGQTKLSFSDFKDLALAEMVRITRNDRPSLSNGDAMWCLLMCDMNVSEALTVEAPPVNKSSLSAVHHPKGDPSSSSPNSDVASELMLAQSPPCSSPTSSSSSPIASDATPISFCSSLVLPECDIQASGGSTDKISSALAEALSNSEEGSGSTAEGKPSLKEVASVFVDSAVESGIHLGSFDNTSVIQQAEVSESSGDMTLLHEDALLTVSADGIPDQGTKLLVKDDTIRPEAHPDPVTGTSHSGHTIDFCKLSEDSTVDIGDPTSTELSLALASGADNSKNKGVTNTEESNAIGKHKPPNEANEIFEALGRKDQLIKELHQRTKELESQLQERTDWARKKVLQAAERLSKDFNELKKLRAEREEASRAEESSSKKLSELENALRKSTSQLDQAKNVARKLEVENAELRAELQAAKLSAAESVASCLEVSKREKKSLKKAQTWEKQRAKLQEELAAERRKIGEFQQQLVQVKERQQQAEVRTRQESKAKDDALCRLEAEKRAREQAEVAAKRREALLQRKAEVDLRRYRDDIHRLEKEVRELRLGSDSTMLSWGSNRVSSFGTILSTGSSPEHLGRLSYEWQDFAQRDVRRDRECVMCLCEEMSVVFLPCAHQVVCSKCNELHEKQGMKDCPSCRTTIQQRISVYGVSS